MTEPTGVSSFLEQRALLKERRGMVIVFGIFAVVCLAAVFLQIAVANLNGKIEKSNADIKSVEDNIAELKTQSGVVSYEILSRAKNEIVGQIEKSRIQNSVRELRKIASSTNFNATFQGFTYSKGAISTSVQFASTPDTNAVEYARRFLEYFREGKSKVFSLGKVTSIDGDERTRTFAVELKILDTKPTSALSNVDLTQDVLNSTGTSSGATVTQTGTAIAPTATSAIGTVAPKTTTPTTSTQK